MPVPTRKQCTKYFSCYGACGHRHHLSCSFFLARYEIYHKRSVDSPDDIRTAKPHWCAGSQFAHLPNDGTTGYYYYTGSGWIRLVTSAAATNLSNLAATTANRSLTPVSNGTFDLGTAALRWRNTYLSGSLTVNSTTGIGVFSTGSNYGLYCYGTYIGVYGNGTSYGVYCTSTTGYGVTGTSSSSGSGVNGFSSSSYGVYGQSGYLGVYGTGTTYGVYGYSGSNYGVYGSSGYIGVLGSGTSYGLYGNVI
jgi:hypothetical protein